MEPTSWRAARDGDWKYARKTEASESQEGLFDLARDLGEQDGLLADEQAETVRLKGLLRAWETGVKAVR